MTFPSDQPGADLTLRITGILGSEPDETGTMSLRIQTTRGEIGALFTPVEGGSGAVIFVSGAMGGLDGPADAIFSRIPSALAERSISSLRIDYREPNNLEECVLDVLAATSFLKGIGASHVVLVGHSFGAAVVISAAELSPIVRGVVAMSTQLHGTRRVEHVEAPILLVHGAADNVLSHEASEDVFRRAAATTRIVLYAETGHSLTQAKDEIWELLATWIPDRLEGKAAVGGRDEIVPTSAREDSGTNI